MLSRAGLVEHNNGVGVYGVSEQRLTDYGAEEITTAFAQRRDLPSEYRLGDLPLIDTESDFDYDIGVPTLLTKRLGAEALSDAELTTVELPDTE